VFTFRWLVRVNAGPVALRRYITSSAELTTIYCEFLRFRK